MPTVSQMVKCWNWDLSLGLLILNPRFLTALYPSSGSALGIIFSFIPSPLITALGRMCYLDVTRGGPVSRAAEQVDENSQRDESG